MTPSLVPHSLPAPSGQVRGSEPALQGTDKPTEASLSSNSRRSRFLCIGLPSLFRRPASVAIFIASV